MGFIGAMKERIGIYPGTFDPITHGHRDIIRRALRVVDRLVIGVAQDTHKNPILNVKRRSELVKLEIGTMAKGDAGRISVKPFSGLLVDFAHDEKATLLIRGLRAVSDFEYEFQMAAINARLGPELETIFLTASESTHFISSRFVKEIARLGGDISHFVSPKVAQKLKEYFKE
jgi:pantetheine-phosphate adenylyltransferase